MNPSTVFLTFHVKLPVSSEVFRGIRRAADGKPARFPHFTVRPPLLFEEAQIAAGGVLCLDDAAETTRGNLELLRGIDSHDRRPRVVIFLVHPIDPSLTSEGRARWEAKIESLGGERVDDFAELTRRIGEAVSAPNIDPKPPLTPSPESAQESDPHEQVLLAKLPEAALRATLDHARAASAKERERYAMDALKLELAPEGAKLIGTDGRRLHVSPVTPCEIVKSHDEQAHGPLLIPASVARMLSQTLRRRVPKNSARSDREDTVLVFFRPSDQRVELRFKRSELVLSWTPATNGDNEFPRYAAVIPEQPHLSATVDAEALQEVLTKACKEVSKDRLGVTLHFGADSLDIAYRSAKGDERNWKVAGPVNAGAATFSVNPQYLKEALRCAGTDSHGSVRLSWNDRTSPVRVEAGEHRNEPFAVVMPITVDV